MKMPVATKSLGSATDLTLIARFKEGMLQQWEACSHLTRASAILRVVNLLRAAREERQTNVYADPIEKVELIHSFRVALTSEPAGQPPRLLLSVTFDHHWEPYIRVVWRDLGPLLDPILCHCEGYPIAVASDFETYAAWVRAKQVSTEWFYNASQLTVTDLGYLTQAEQMLRDQRRVQAADLEITRFAALTPEEALAEARKSGLIEPGEVQAQAVSALGAFHSLVRYYGATPVWPAGHDRPNDAALLLRLAQGVVKAADVAALPAQLKALHAGAIAWFNQTLPADPRAPATPPAFTASNVQAGILSGFQGAGTPPDHGVVLLLQLADPAQAAAARAWVAGFAVTAEGSSLAPGTDWQLALSYRGLERLGVEADELARFPQEFRDGAEARAPQLGDQRLSHPRNWKLPPRNWPEGQAGFVKLDRIDVLIQLRVNGAGAAVHDFFERDGSGSPVHPLFAAVSGLATGAGKKGLRLVSVTPMLAASAGAGASGLDHFGLMDGISQPEPKDQPPPLASGWTNETAMGAFVIGQPDGSGDRLPTTSAGLREGGSFLVVRRMRQHRDRFEALVAKAMAQSNRPRQLVIEKMLGRGEDGSSPVSASANDFDYSGDPTGAKCPLQSHIRRANPRLPGGPLKAPRLMRRGMSFGPRVNGPASWSQERGVMFMAYCASLAEQFEVIQRWVNGGNSTRIGSFLTDPLMGVPRRKDRRTFRFEVDGRVYRIDLNPDDLPAITLEWMAYFFVPGLPALRNLGDFAGAPAARTDTAATEGQQLVGMLLQEGEAAREKWQVVLDDAGSRVAGVTATAWAGVRTGPPQPESAAWAPGVVRCPYGTRSDTTLLVGSDALMREVLDPSSDAGQAVSVGGYNGRAKDSMGEIYLGLDPGERYDEESVVPNDAISAVSRDRAFALALAAGQQALQRLLAGQAKVSGPVTVYFDAVFAILCRTYFDVPDGQNIVPGGLDFRDVGSRRPICPGDYYSPSRYMFDPTPSDEGVRMGKAHGNALFEATKALAKDGMAWNGIISKPIADQLLTRPAADVQLFARTHVGVMMGFLPTCWGSLIGIFDDWMASGALWDRQDALVVTQGWGQLAPMLAQIGAAALLQPQNAAAILQAAAVHPVLAGADAVLDLAMRQAMQRRPAPDFIWRTARKAGSLGGVAFKKGDVLALSIYSVTLELQGKGDFSVMPIFGGTRGTGRPTHACPGYEMAMGTLLGTITALLSFANLRPATGPLTLELSSRLQG